MKLLTLSESQDKCMQNLVQTASVVSKSIVPYKRTFIYTYNIYHENNRYTEIDKMLCMCKIENLKYFVYRNLWSNSVVSCPTNRIQKYS